ncbi:MAG: hypothetical protein J6M35_05925 [Clostridia bacterium]|nr:hypothetical protein [Clostridia bacterium]
MKKVITFFVVAVVLLPVIVITASNIGRFFHYLEKGYEFEKIVGIMGLSSIKGLFNIILLVLAVILFVRTYWFTSFVFKRIVLYFKLSVSCLKRRYKFGLKRFPLASLFGMRVKEDICIKNSKKTFCVHFVDVIGRGLIFSIVNGNEYDIATTVPDPPKRLGAAYYGGATGAKLSVVMSSTIHSGETMKFPEFDPSIGEHIIILNPLPMEVRYIDSSVPKPLFSGYSVGNITYYEAKDFIKLLKRV